MLVGELSVLIVLKNNMPTQQEEMNNILEKFAEQEHIRWAKWQNYLHSFLTWNNDIQAWVLPHEKKEHWQRQIQTPYSMLSEKEKDSDREQVKPYLAFLQSEISLAVAQREKEMLENMMVILGKLEQTKTYGLSSAIAEYKSNIINLITKHNDKQNN